MFMWTSTKPLWSLKPIANKVARGTGAIVLPRQGLRAKEKKFLGRELIPILVSLKSYIQIWFTAGPHQSADGQKNVCSIQTALFPISHTLILGPQCSCPSQGLRKCRRTVGVRAACLAPQAGSQGPALISWPLGKRIPLLQPQSKICLSVVLRLLIAPADLRKAANSRKLSVPPCQGELCCLPLHMLPTLPWNSL